MDQHAYPRKLEQLQFDAIFSQFRSMRMKLARLSNSRHDVLKQLNKAVKFAIDKKVSLQISWLDKDSLRIIGFSDASFANNEDLSSQLGHIVFLGDRKNKVVLI